MSPGPTVSTDTGSWASPEFNRGWVIALFGPTGVGKTEVAAEIASVLGVSVVSCDSMQLYSGCPVLTNQPPSETLGRAPHALSGVADPGERWTVMDYAFAARKVIDESLARRGWAVLAGGTGLYMRAALAHLDAPPVRDDVLRRKLEERAAREGGESLQRELEERDPEAARSIDSRNVRRLVRALEVVLLQGKGAWSGRDDLWRPVYRHPTLVFGLTMEREPLYERIALRTCSILRSGAVDEVRRLRLREGGAPAVRDAIGYREIESYLDGDMDFAELERRVAAATRRYARRQLTWLRRLSDVVMIDVSRRDPVDVAGEVLQRVRWAAEGRSGAEESGSAE